PLAKGTTLSVETRHNICTLQATLSMHGVFQQPARTSPTQLVATFAHELSHYLTCTANEPPPGGWDNWEFATDIAATFLGFGVFMANSSFNFS
ncbi:hypothetical protein SCD92_17290, partial [Gilvimarinus sp. SDUM040013]